MYVYLMQFARSSPQNGPTSFVLQLVALSFSRCSLFLALSYLRACNDTCLMLARALFCSSTLSLSLSHRFNSNSQVRSFLFLHTNFGF